MRIRAAALLGLVCCLTPNAARAQQGVAPVRVPLAATTADFGWLAGHWEGRLAGATAVADVTYTAPKAGLITGVMRLVDGDKVLVVELISMVDTPNGVEMRFRHFGSDLSAYETEFRQAMVLTAHDATEDRFENQVPFDAKLMSTEPRTTRLVRRGADAFVGRSDIIGSDGKPAVIEVTYERK